MAINFPNSPTTGQLYTFNDTTWQWSGEYWNVYSAQTGYITTVSNAGNGFPVIDSVTSNALTLKSFSGTNMTITDSGGQLNFFVPLNGGGGGQLYYFNISKTQTPYLELATSATTGAERSITSAVTSGNTVTIGQFLTPSGYPGVSILPGGVWSFYLHTYKQNSSASFDIFCDVYKRTSGGTETLLFSTDPVTVLSNSPTPIMVISDTYYSGATLNTSDRILVNVRGTNTSNNTYSITFVSEGLQHYSYVSSPLLLRTTDIYVDSFTYTPSANTVTIGQTESFPPQSITINSFSGLTIDNTLRSNTISATTYQNLPTDIRVTGGTYTNGTATFTNNTGGTFNVTGFFTGVTDVRVTGATYNNNTFTFTNNTGGTFNVLFNTVTGLTVNGNLSATTISATIYNNLPNTLYTGNGSILSNRTVLQPDTTLTFSGTSSSSFIVLENFKQGDPTNLTPGLLSFAQGSYTNSNGDYSHAEGNGATTLGIYSHAEGLLTTSIGDSSHSEGRITVSNGDYSHAEGIGRFDGTGSASPAAGLTYLEFTIPGGVTFTSNTITYISSNSLEFPGDLTYLPSPTSIVNLFFDNVFINPCFYPDLSPISISYDNLNDVSTITFSTSFEADYFPYTGCTGYANGVGSHSEGLSTRANGNFSHSEGIGTYADGEGQHVSGKYNITGNTTSLFVIGNGSDDYNRSDILNVNTNGAILFGSFTANTISATTYENVNAVTGGTFQNGVITLSGTGNVNGIQITGFSTSTATQFTGGTVTGATNFTNGLTANTISATTISATNYQNLPSQSGTGVSAFSYAPTTGILTITRNDTTTVTAGTFSYVTAVTESANIITVTSNGGSPSTLTIDAVTGGTFSSSTGIITLSGTGNVNGTQITGFTSSGEVNTASNLGSGTGLFAQKSGVDLQFKSLTSTGNTVTITNNVTTVNLEASSSPGGGMTWNSANTTQSMSSDNGYITTAATLTTFTLPTTIALGRTVEIAGNSSGLWRLNQNSGQQIRFGNQTTNTTSGILSATSQGDCVKLICTSANTSFIVTSSIGNIFFN